MNTLSIDNNSENKEKIDIYIVGLGISNVDHITRQAERVLRSSNEILYLDNGIGVKEFLETLCPVVTDLISESYEEDGKLIDAYYNMSAHVVDSAMTRGPVSFALYGHPTTFALPPTMIKEAAKLLDLKVKVIPGISAIDCICADLMIDPLCQGLQSFEATDLIARRYELNAELPAMIWQIGSVESTIFSSRPNLASRYRKLSGYLSNIYGDDHSAYAVFSSSFALLNSKIVEFPLKNMEDFASEFHNGYTLYIPPRYERPLMDEEVVANADSFKHLQKLTE